MRLPALRYFVASRVSPVLFASACFQTSTRTIATANPLMSGKKIFDDSDEVTRKTKQEIANLPEKQLYPEYAQTEKGIVYDKKPFKYPCIEGKAYIWCSCGRSHQQPFCDGTHNNKHLKITLRPMRWDCPESKDYWFCNCKQTKHPPFCDGTHKQPHIQAGHTTVRDVHSPPVIPEKIKQK